MPADSGPPPPGQERPYPKPTQSGRIPFSYGEDLKNAETAYWIWGDLKTSSSPPLICMHGGPGMGHDYLLPTALLATDYGIPVLMYDQVGCGHSTHFRERKGDEAFWTPQLFMAELDNLKAALGITTFDLLGQSWGGMCAGQYAIEKQPKGLRKLIIANSPSDMATWVKTAGRLRLALPAGVQEALTRNEEAGTTGSEEYQNAVTEFYKRHLCRLDPFPAELNAILKNVEDDPTVYETMNGPSEFHVVGTIRSWTITERLHEITAQTCPGGLLVINGNYDEAQDETTAAFFERPTCKTKWIRYALSSHTPMLEETEKYLRDLGAFLKAE